MGDFSHVFIVPIRSHYFLNSRHRDHWRPPPRILTRFTLHDVVLLIYFLSMYSIIISVSSTLAMVFWRLIATALFVIR